MCLSDFFDKVEYINGIVVGVFLYGYAGYVALFEKIHEQIEDGYHVISTTCSVEFELVYAREYAATKAIEHGFLDMCFAIFVKIVSCEPKVN